MTNNDFYNQVLGLSRPWSVRDVVLDTVKKTVHVRVDYAPSLGRLQCSKCEAECPGYDTMEERSWRHLDTCQLMTYLICSLPRVDCPEHGVVAAKAAWATPSSRFTILFEQFAIAILLGTRVQCKAAEILRLSSGQIHRIMERAVQRGLLRRDTTLLMRRVSLDEKSVASGHKYITVLSDSARGTVLDVADSRTKEAVQTLLRETLSSTQKEQIACVTMDMWHPFAEAVRTELPAAEVAHDRFHIAQYLGIAVDDTRKAEHARLSKEGESPLAKSKYVWLKNPNNLTSTQNAMLLDLQNSQLETPKVWGFKEAFKEFFNCDPEAAQTFFENWYEQALSLKNKYLTKAAGTLHRHIKGRIAAIKHKASNAIAEAINSKIQALKTAARGFRSFDNYRIAILFFYGGLSLDPQNSL